MDQNTTDMNEQGKYPLIVSIISDIEKRIASTDALLLALSLALVIFIVNLSSNSGSDGTYTPLELFNILICTVVGMAICTYWIVVSLRMQLKLKLKYFQARFIERREGCSGDCFYSEESVFFDPAVMEIESPDGKDTLHYPSKGLTRMDGIVGAAKPRYFTWIMPITFTAIYWIILVSAVLNALQS